MLAESMGVNVDSLPSIAGLESTALPAPVVAVTSPQQEATT